MMKLWFTSTTLSAGLLLAACAADVRVIGPANPTPRERLAAAELVRYVYLRTERLPRLGGPEGEGRAILLVRGPERLGPQEYELKTAGRRTTITGGDDRGILYGAYRFVEALGVRFYLHGDVVPDAPLAALPDVNETGRPLFGLRGVNPWGSHPFGFDAWSADDYKAVFAQLTKLRMNFLGVHCYPEGHPYAEPTVWHGLSGDFDARGRVKHSYVSRYFNTLLTPGWGDYRPKQTGDYAFGGALLFADDAWAPNVLREHCPLPSSPAACNEVFNRMAAQWRDAFTFARRLGVQTCLGTEAPLGLPAAVRDRVRAAGRDPADPAVTREVYEATFRRIMAAHPLDYYWLWTPEGWTWEGNQPAQYSNTVADVRLAFEALTNVRAPFRLATAGWVLGPAHDRAAFDRDLPKAIPMSAISRNTGATEIDPAFARIFGREKWAIPWLESDNRHGLAAVQLEVGRLRYDAADALAYGCTGLMGLHWRTEDVAPNIAALAQAAWDQRWERPARIALPGHIAQYPDAAIAGTPDAPLYRSCRYDLGTIRLPVPAGQYTVTLKFCEPHFKAAGERVCDVQLEGRTVLTNLDIFARVGRFAALDFVFPEVPVTNGVLTLELVARKSLPCISAVAVEGRGFATKINCGGPAYQDWLADDGTSRSVPCEDFYADWAQANFGLAEAGTVLAAIDGRVPQVTDGGCPAGSLTPVKEPWSAVAPQFAFVDDLAEFRPRVRGAGNLDRFDRWLNAFEYLRSLAQLRCALARPDANELTRLYAQTYRHLLASVNTPGGLAMVVNLESHPGWGPAIAAHVPEPWPKAYSGAPRIVMPTVRSVLGRGERLAVTFVVLDDRPPESVTLAWRPLGRGTFRTLPGQLVARAAYRVELPPAKASFEYRIEATLAGGRRLVWPPTAPALPQTVVCLD